MLNEQELIQQQMEKTRGSLTEKLEALEGQVTETVSSTAGAVQDTTQSVQETVTGAVDAVKDTVASVTDKVQETMTSVTDKFQETVQSVSDSFNINVQMERHPWIILGGAAAVGYLVGSAFASSREYRPSAAMPHSSPPSAPQSNHDFIPHFREAEPAAVQESGVWTDAVSHLKDIGVSYLMGLVRDLAKQGLPDVIGQRVAEEVDSLTTKMGTEPIPGSVLPQMATSESSSEPNAADPADFRDKKSSSYRGRTPAVTSAI